MSPTTTPQNPVEPRTTVSSVYGPVQSWRYGQSLGIDLIRDHSTCSFNCIYCQLGDIQVKTNIRQCFVPTQTVLDDLDKSPWHTADVITISGSGEPTLATNLGDVIIALKAKTGKRIMVLTNGTLLHDPQVQQDLLAADEVAVKLDAATEAGFQQMNRPVPGVTLAKVITAVKIFQQIYPGKLSIQTMVMPTNRNELDALADVIRDIQPDEVQLNTPKRPYPLQWVVDSRGNHVDHPDYPTQRLKTIDPDEALAIEQELAQKTGVPIRSYCRRGSMKAD